MLLFIVFMLYILPVVRFISAATPVPISCITIPFAPAMSPPHCFLFTLSYDFAYVSIRAYRISCRAIFLVLAYVLARLQSVTRRVGTPHVLGTHYVTAEDRGCGELQLERTRLDESSGLNSFAIFLFMCIRTDCTRTHPGSAIRNMSPWKPTDPLFNS